MGAVTGRKMALRGTWVVEALRGGLDHDDETEQVNDSELEVGGGRGNENGGGDAGAGVGQQQKQDDEAKEADSDDMPGGGEVARAMANNIDGGAWNAEEDDEKLGREWQDLVRRSVLELQLEHEADEPENEQEYRNQQVFLAPQPPSRKDLAIWRGNKKSSLGFLPRGPSPPPLHPLHLLPHLVMSL